MPELPEIETTVRDLRQKVINEEITDFWSDVPKRIHFFDKDGNKETGIKKFTKNILGKKIKDITREGKNIIFFFSGNTAMLVHQKISGHLLMGNWTIENDKPISTDKNMQDRVNTYIHMIFTLKSKKMMALSDLRKFAKVEFYENPSLLFEKLKKEIGPDPLTKDFNFEVFKNIVKGKKTSIKKIIMEQKLIAGIGNIYASEILWDAKINPLREGGSLKEKEIKAIQKSIVKILQKALDLKGDSFSDYRLITGEKGGYQEIQKVYQKDGKPCPRNDGGVIERVKIANRSSFFCPICQK